jgi:hypothetical protein
VLDAVEQPAGVVLSHAAREMNSSTYGGKE